MTGDDTVREVKLQADCDAVDFIKGCESRFMFALKDMGWQWKTGVPSAVSQYGQRYVVWANGDYKLEGEPMRKRSDLSEIVNDAIAEFRRMWGVCGERFIVWRYKPELSALDGKAKIWLRFHTQREIPADYLTKASA